MSQADHRLGDELGCDADVQLLGSGECRSRGGEDGIHEGKRPVEAPDGPARSRLHEPWLTFDLVDVS